MKNFDRHTIFRKAYGCLAGVAIGDAMGMPVEMLSPDEIKQIYGFIEDFVRAPSYHPSSILKAGHITDDTEETLLLADILIRYDGEITTEIVADEFVKWAKSRNIFDVHYIGPSTKNALKKILEGKNPAEAGEGNTTSGAAMRVVPVGIVNVGEIEKAAIDAVKASLPTHGDRVALSATAAVACAVAEAMKTKNTIESIVNSAIVGSQIGFNYGRPISAPSIEKRIRTAVSLARRYDDPFRAANQMYHIIGMGLEAAEAIPSAFGIFVAAEGDPMQAILVAINTGGDADTIAAISGALGGAWKGIESIDLSKLKRVEETNCLDIKKVVEKLADIAYAHRV